MSKLRARLRVPNPAMIVAIVALIAALGGSAYAGSKIGYGELSKKAKNKTTGVGPLEYVDTAIAVPPTADPGPGHVVAAYCPPDTYAIGGGIWVSSDRWMYVNDSHLIGGGWAGTVYNTSAVARTAVVTLTCATSRDVDADLSVAGS